MKEALSVEDTLKLALEALKMADELCRGHGVDFKEYGLEFDRDIQVKYKDAITAIKEALAQPGQEPVAYLSNKRQRLNIELKPQTFVEIPTATDWEMPLYMKPPQRTWVGLSDEEIKAFDTWHDNREEEVGWCNPSEIVAYIEAKLKEKNT